MTALFRGGELEAFIPSGSGVTEVTTADTFNSSFCRCSIQIAGPSSAAPANHPKRKAKDAARKDARGALMQMENAK